MADSGGTGGERAGEIRAAGAVLWRPAAGGVQVALIHRDRYDDWTFPKGKALPGEHTVLAAAREVAEETGIQVVLGRRLATVHYLSGGKPKRVDYWAARPAGPPDGGQPEFEPNDEVDGLAWLPLAAARDRLTYGHDADLLDGFAARPAQTVPVVLLRHASSRSKTDWQAEGHTGDLTRPLTRAGLAEARELAEVLGCFGPARVVSSPAERCLASVRPYAALAGSDVEAEPAFAVGTGGPRVPTAAQERAAALVAGGGPVLMCGHRENLPAMLAGACRALHAEVPAGEPLPKGGFWVLHAAAGQLVCAEQHSLDR
jgi:8-oxo-dGTP pyrophosphatase MutT (NUDIX family)/phosphohistidine phosphatase SixA